VKILESYEILERIGYITLDNAANMDTAAEEITEALGLDPKKRRVRCFGHVLILVVKALLFGHKTEAFEAEVDGEPGFNAAQHEIWRKKRPHWQVPQPGSLNLLVRQANVSVSWSPRRVLSTV
jgi:hypothetical protein